jgi:cardiolipin synthase A/B
MQVTVVEFLFQYFATVLGLGLGLILIARVLRRNARPSVSISWLLAIILIPYIGVPAYIIFGGRKLSWWAGAKKPLYNPVHPLPFDAAETPSRIEDVLIAAGMPPARTGGSADFLPDGETTYEALLDMIEAANERIHVMTFILGRDDVGRTIIDALAHKAQQGIEVRLLLDSFGALMTRRNFIHPLGRFVAPLRRAGGQVGMFMPLFPPRLRTSINLRNHRKIVVVDGKTALIGGMNLSSEYLGANSDPNIWIDTAAIIRGPVVEDFERIFESDWNFARQEDFRIECPCEPEAADRVRPPMLQVAASGPDVEGEPLYEALLAACFEATRRIWIVTPYFVPDEGIFRALSLQARMETDVRIVLPARSNHPLADIARGRFLRQLADAGARIYFHHGSMIHAKHAVFDDGLSMAGSANLDMRSLYLNYEVALFFHSAGEVRAVARWMERLMDESEVVTAEDLKAGYIKQWAEDLSLLVSPLL